jgi:hypothetical protein
MAKRQTNRRTATARSTSKRKATRPARAAAKAKPAARASAGRSSSAAKSSKSPARKKPAKLAARSAPKALAKKLAKKIVKQSAMKASTKGVRKAASKAVPEVARKLGTQPTAQPKAARTVKKAAPTVGERSAAGGPAIAKRPYLDRERRRLEEDPVQTPPSSLDMDRHGSAARSGRAALNKSLKEHTGMTPELTSGDIDGDWENAYFSGEEAPGGDNPSPDENVVDDIGKALGVEYQDGEELKASDKVGERDEHRWELDPASAEDYEGRK